MRFLVLILVWAICWEWTCEVRAQGIASREWQPSLRQTRDLLEAELKEAKGRKERSSLTRRLADIADAELFIVYLRLYGGLNPAEREALEQEQRQWLNARKKLAEDTAVYVKLFGPFDPGEREALAHAKDRATSGDGSMAPAGANYVECSFTDKRTKELEQRLKKVEGKQG